MLNKSFVDLVEKDSFPDLKTLLSIRSLFINIAVNKDVAIWVLNS